MRCFLHPAVVGHQTGQDIFSLSGMMHFCGTLGSHEESAATAAFAIPLSEAGPMDWQLWIATLTARPCRAILQTVDVARCHSLLLLLLLRHHQHRHQGPRRQDRRPRLLLPFHDPARVGVLPTTAHLARPRPPSLCFQSDRTLVSMSAKHYAYRIHNAGTSIGWNQRLRASARCGQIVESCVLQTTAGTGG